MNPKLMGVVNVTPDSFSDGGLYLDAAAAIAHGRELAEQGAEILDVGGESTRPGAEEVSEEVELARVLPVVEGLARGEPTGAADESELGAAEPEEAAASAVAPNPGEATVSIDTSKLGVAEAALDAGAEVVNDVTALRRDPEIGALCAERGAGLVLMHMLGDPRSMQEDPVYEDVVGEVKAFLAGRLEVAVGAGVEEERIWLDPGIGFGKTLEHNLELLRKLGELRELGRPLVVGASRKSFIGRIDGSPVGERLGGTIASSVLAAAEGAEVLRVHDVAEARQALTVARAVLG
jgi:dihydropteroate synthase